MSRLNDAEAPVGAEPVTYEDPVSGLVGTKTARPVRGEIEDTNIHITSPGVRLARSLHVARRWLWHEGKSVTMRPNKPTTVLLGRSNWNERQVGEWDVEAAFGNEAVYVRRLATKEQVAVSVPPGLMGEVTRPIPGGVTVVNLLQSAIGIGLEMLFPEHYTRAGFADESQSNHARLVEEFNLSSTITTALGLSSWMKAKWPVGCLLRWREAALFSWPQSGSADSNAVLAWRVRRGDYHENVGDSDWWSAGNAQARAALQAVDKGNAEHLPRFALCLRDDASVAWLTERVTRLGMAVTSAPGGAWLVTGRVNLARAAGVKLKGYAYGAAETDVMEVDERKGVAIAKAVYSAAEALRLAVDIEERRKIAKSMGIGRARA